MKSKLYYVLLSLFLILLTSCSKTTNDEPIVLTINYPSSEVFYTKFGYPFEQKYPHIKINVIEQNLDEPTLLTSDIIFMNSLNKYKEIAEQHQLYSLSTLMLKDNKDFSSLSPVVKETLTLNDGEVYGLAPTFNSNGLFYNIDLFQTYNVPLPHNQMTWSQLFELANQFPNEQADGSKLYGFTSNYYKEVPINLILRMGMTEGLTYINPETYEININTPEWIDIGKTVLNAIEKKTIFNEEEEALGDYGEGPLLTGHSAMQIASQYTAINFEMYDSQSTNEVPQWGVVTVPVNQLTPTYSDSYRFDEIYGIHTQTQHKEAAWTFIKFIQNDAEYYANYLNTFWQYGIPANDALRTEVTEQDLSALYLLSPQNQSYDSYDVINHEVINAFKTESQKVIDDYLVGAITLEECFQRIEENGQAIVNTTVKEVLNESYK